MDRIRGEFLEMPGLCLTAVQAERLLGLDAPVCQVALDALIRVGFLARGKDGRYRRLAAAA